MDFGKGVALGISIAFTLVIALVAFELPDMGALYGELGDVKLPLLTRITITRVWLAGVPLAGTVACVGLFVARPRSLAPYVAVAIVLAVCVVLTWFGPRLPIFELAGNIKAD